MFCLIFYGYSIDEKKCDSFIIGLQVPFVQTKIKTPSRKFVIDNCVFVLSADHSIEACFICILNYLIEY